MKTLVLLSVLLLTVSSAISQPTITFQTLASGLEGPVDIVSANDGAGRLFIVERKGKVKIWDGAALLPTPFVNLSPLVRFVGGEQGLLSLAFHPDYATNGYFFVYYTNLSGDVTIARYNRSSLNSAEPTSGVVLMTIYKPYENHNGGKLNFGPDGNLYFGIGDGGSGGDPGHRAQNGDSLLGKMLRINVNNPNPPYYSIPATNPYINNAAVRDEIIAFGLRNPWRWSFDRMTGDMWLADVGEVKWEEVNFRPADSITDINYGWNCFEGTHVYPDGGCTAQHNKITPIFDYPHNLTTGGFSITGGFVYRGAEFPALQGYYIASDYVSNHGWLIKSNGNNGWDVTMQSSWANKISTYGEGEDGTLYAASLGDGKLYKILVDVPLPVRLVSFNGRQNGNFHELNWQVQNEEKNDIYIVEQRVDPAQPFKEVSRQVSSADNSSNKYLIKVPATGKISYYRLQVKSQNNNIHYSPIVTIANSIKQTLKAVVNGNILQIILPANAISIKAYDAAGKLILQKKIAGNNQIENISLQNFSRGVVTVNVQLQNNVETVRVVY